MMTSEIVREQLPIEAIVMLALRGDRYAIARAIDAEIDYNGTFVGFGQSERIWHKVESGFLGE